jgi:hypothetical protein
MRTPGVGDPSRAWTFRLATTDTHPPSLPYGEDADHAGEFERRSCRGGIGSLWPPARDANERTSGFLWPTRKIAARLDEADLAHVGGALTGLLIVWQFADEASYVGRRNAAGEGGTVYEGPE